MLLLSSLLLYSWIGVPHIQSGTSLFFQTFLEASSQTRTGICFHGHSGFVNLTIKINHHNSVKVVLVLFLFLDEDTEDQRLQGT